MRTVYRDSFARHTIKAERVTVSHDTCIECGTVRGRASCFEATGARWLYRFHVDDDQGARGSGPILGGKLFCSRACAEAYGGGVIGR